MNAITTASSQLEYGQCA